MSETRQLICEGACNPLLKRLDEQRISATQRWRPEHMAMPSMPEGWVDAMRQQVHTTHRREAQGFMPTIWTCDVCGAQRRF